MDGLQWKITLKWMITRGIPILGNLQLDDMGLSCPMDDLGIPPLMEPPVCWKFNPAWIARSGAGAGQGVVYQKRHHHHHHHHHHHFLDYRPISSNISIFGYRYGPSSSFSLYIFCSVGWFLSPLLVVSLCRRNMCFEDTPDFEWPLLHWNLKPL